MRELLIVHALALLEESGLSGFTGREVARRAGLSHGAPRRFFPTLNALLAAVAAAGFEQMQEAIFADADDFEETDPRERLIAVARSYIRFAVERPSLFELMFRHDMLADSGEGLRTQSLPLYAFAQKLVSEISGAPETAARDIWIGVHGLANLSSRRALEVITDEAVDSLLRRQIENHLRPGHGDFATSPGAPAC